MIKPFTFGLRTTIIYGEGVSRQLGERALELGGKRALVVTDPGIEKAGILQGPVESLKKAGLDLVVFPEVEANPETSTLERGREIALRHSCDIVVGIGGGSSIDAGKGIAISVTNPDPIASYEGLNKVKVPGLPMIAIPTTAGTGAEITIWAVLTDSSRRMKIGVGSPYCSPTYALCDPLLTVSMPPSVTAITGMDALTHAVESYVNTATQPPSEALAMRAITLIGANLRTAVYRGDNLEARDAMLMGSLLAAMAFNSTRLGIAHALAMPLGSWDIAIPHGLANAIVLPAVIEYNHMARPEKYAEIARALGENIDGLSLRDAAYKAVEAVRELTEDIDIRLGLSQLGVKEEHLEKIASEAIKSGNILVNPRSCTVKNLMDILRRSM